MEKRMTSALIVEDDEYIRHVVNIALTRVSKWNITAVDSGRAALDVVHSVNPDFILLDVMMPGMDGITTYQNLRAQGVTVPVIFLTAKVEQQEVSSYIELGVAGVLTKPFDPMTLSKQIERILAPSSFL
jgi:two-component system OmpR family response regulator